MIQIIPNPTTSLLSLSDCFNCWQGDAPASSWKILSSYFGNTYTTILDFIKQLGVLRISGKIKLNIFSVVKW